MKANDKMIKKMVRLHPIGALNLIEAILELSIEDAVKCMYIADDFLLNGRKEIYRLDNDIWFEDYEQCFWHILSIYNFLHNAPYHLQPAVKNWSEFTKVIIKECTKYSEDDKKHVNVSSETCDYLRGFYDRIFNTKTD